MHSWLPKRFPDKAWNGQCGPTRLLCPRKQHGSSIRSLQLLPLPQNTPVCCKTPRFCSFLLPRRSSTFSSTCLSSALPSMAWGPLSPVECLLTPLQPYHAFSLTSSIHDSNQISGAFSHMLIRHVVSLFQALSPQQDGRLPGTMHYLELALSRSTGNQ